MEKSKNQQIPPRIETGIVRHEEAATHSIHEPVLNNMRVIEQAVGNSETRRLLIPNTLVSELEKVLGRKLTNEDQRDILSAPSMIKEIENKLNSGKPEGMLPEHKRKLTEGENRQILIANGVKERHVNVNNVSTFYLEAGDPSKETVLLVHGGGNASSYRAWKYQILELAKDYHIIAPDLPGFGNTPKPEQKCTLDYYVKTFFGKFMDAIGIEKADVVSSSMGGWIALGFTIDNPSRVNKLIGIGSGGLSDKKTPLLIRELMAFPPVSKFLIKTLHRNGVVVKKVLKALTGKEEIPERFLNMTREYLDKDGFTTAFLEFVNDQMQADPKQVGSDIIKSKREKKEIKRGFKTVYTNGLEKLNAAKVPYLLVHGIQDPIFELPSIEAAAEVLKYCTLKKFECMHGPHLELPTEFNPALLEFLSKSNETYINAGKGKLMNLLRNMSDTTKPQE